MAEEKGTGNRPGRRRGGRKGRGRGIEPLVDPRALAEKLGHLFANESLLATALTHPSHRNEFPDEPDYERLEFLGDAILNLLVARDLFDRFPQMDQGELTRGRSALVKEACLAAVARELDLGRFLRLARGERALGGSDKPSILADAMEAVAAAVFLDGGFEAAAGLVSRLFGPLYDQAVSGKLGGDLKTVVNDLVWRRFHDAVAYVQSGASGPPHEPTFEVELKLGEKVLGRGKGGSKKEAEQEAARAALARLGGAGSTEEDENWS